MTDYVDAAPLDPMLEFDSQLERLRELAGSIAGSQVSADRNPVELIPDNSAMHRLFDRLQEDARHAVRIMDRPPYVTTPRAQADLQVSRMSAGVAYRSIYATEVLDNPVLLQVAHHLARAGEQARLLPQIPMKIAIGDTDLALIAIPEGPRGPSGHLAVRRSGLLDGIIAMFETLWTLATPPPGAAVGSPPDDHGPHDREVLLLLAAGATDEAIARHLKVSRRTAQRRVKALLDSLNVKTRFQAGIQAARRNWL